MRHRLVTAVIAVPFVALAAGFVLRLPWATALWPYETGRLTYLFLGSMVAAVAAAAAYVVGVRDWGATAGGAVNLLIAFGGFALFLGYQAAVGEARLWPYAVGSGAIALGAGLAVPWALRQPFADTRRTPRAVFLSFGLFIAVLVGTGTALLLRIPVMPWPLDPGTSVMVGTIFIADASYFAFGLARPVWSNARGQLLAFLAYDLVLIVPLVAHFGAVKPDLRLNLAIYTAVVVYSALLSAYYLLVSREWRITAPAAGAQGTVPQTALG